MPEIGELPGKESPLHITTGEVLVPQTVEGTKYSFMHIGFGDIQISTFTNEQATLAATDPGAPKLENVNQMIYFKTIGQTGFTIPGEEISPETEGGDTDKDPLKSQTSNQLAKNSGFITTNGTIIPNFVYFKDQFGKNTLVLEGSEEAKKQEENKKGKDDNGDGQNEPVPVTEYNWIATKVIAEKVPKPDDPKTTEAIGELKNYGSVCEVDTKNSYISVAGRNPLFLKDADSFEQKFACDFVPANAFALLLDFVNYELIPNKNCGVKFRFFSEKENGDDKGEAAGDEVDIIPDEIVFTSSPNTDIKVEINNNGGAQGPLIFTQQGTKIEHTNSDSLKSKNVAFFYCLMNDLMVTGDLVTDPTQRSKQVACKKIKDLDISKITKPPINKFPNVHKSQDPNKSKNNDYGEEDKKEEQEDPNAGEEEWPTNQIILDAPQAYINFGEKVECTWYNCDGNFAFAKLQYCPTIEFSYYYRIVGEPAEQTKNPGESGGSSSDEDPNANSEAQTDDYFLLEVAAQANNYKIDRDLRFNPTFISYDAETQTCLYRVDIKIASDGTAQDKPCEIFGLIHVTSRTGKLTDVLNNDGDFYTNFTPNVLPDLYTTYTGGQCDASVGWEKFIVSANIQHGLDGASGSLTLDKYLMMDLNVAPQQVIGALTLIAENGFYKEDGSTMNGGTHTIKMNSQYSMPWGQIFKGYAMEIQDQVSDGSSTLTVKLAGIQKKLEDMALVNCPFWDGDPVFAEGADGVLNYFRSYSGCDLKFVEDFSDPNVSSPDKIILPRSWDWQSPAVNFVMGTTCLNALNEIAKKISFRFVVQPDGCGYFYHLNSIGAPDWILTGPVVATFSPDDIISMDLAPYLDNKYNTFLTLGVLKKEDSKEGTFFPAGDKPGNIFTVIDSDISNYPWSRIFTFSEPGIVTMKDLVKYHNINMAYGTSDTFQGSITIPGCHAFFMFDKIQIGEKQFYLTGVTHNLNMQSKEWTTQLSIAKNSLLEHMGSEEGEDW